MSLPEDNELNAAAWELTGLLGIDIFVRENELVLDYDQVKEWWVAARGRVMPAYQEHLSHEKK